MAKVQFELSEDRVRELESLMRESGTSTKKDFINNALTFLAWAIQERKAGKRIASVDEESKQYKEITMPILDAVGKK